MAESARSALVKSLAKGLGTAPHPNRYQDSPSARALIPASVNDPYAYAHLQGARARDQEYIGQYENAVQDANIGTVGKINDLIAAEDKGTGGLGGLTPSVLSALVRNNPAAAEALLRERGIAEQDIVRIMSENRAVDSLKSLTGSAASGAQGGMPLQRNEDFLRMLESASGISGVVPGPTSIDAALATTTTEQSVNSDGTLVRVQGHGGKPAPVADAPTQSAMNTIRNNDKGVLDVTYDGAFINVTYKNNRPPRRFPAQEFVEQLANRGR